MRTDRLRGVLAAFSVLLVLGVEGECPVYTYKVHGRVKSAGQPVAGLVVSYTVDGEKTEDVVRTDPDGAFVLSIHKDTHAGGCMGSDRCRPPRGPSLAIAMSGPQGSAMRAVNVPSDPGVVEQEVDLGVFELKKQARVGEAR